MAKTTPGGMVLATDKSNICTEYSMIIPCNHNDEGDLLIISDMFDFSFTIKNIYTGERQKTYYHLEVDKKSEFYHNFREVMKKMLNLKDNNET